MAEKPITPEGQLRVPQEWVERRIAQINPDLSASAVEELEAERDSIRDTPLRLSCRLDISFFPQKFEQTAAHFAMSQDDMMQSIAADFAEGVAVFNPNEEFRLLGARWRVIVRRQTGKTSDVALGVAVAVQQLDIPTNQPRFSPESVSFSPIWDEEWSDPSDWLTSYQSAHLRLTHNLECERELNGRLSQLKRERPEAIRRTQDLLECPRPDKAIALRSHLHATVRRRYSALRVLMDLLRIRAETETYEYQASVEGDAASPKGPAPAEIPNVLPETEPSTDTAFLRLRLDQRAPATILDEETLIELRPANRSRSIRARVRAVLPTTQGTIVEVDLPADLLPPGDPVTLSTVSRFGMKTHQRAVQNMLDERAEGYWPDLAKLLTSPNELEAHENAPPEDAPNLPTGGPSLNERQRRAVAGALATRHAFCIQGPPGTGKTTVICEIIQRLVAKGERILLVAPTHVAVDEVLRRIGSREGIRALRISWDDAKVAEDVRKYMPANIIEPFLDRSAELDSATPRRWQHESCAISNAISALKRLQTAQEVRAHAEQQSMAAQAALQAATHAVATQEPGLREIIRTGLTAKEAGDQEIAALTDTITRLGQDYAQAHQAANWFSRAASLIGLGDLARVARQKTNLEKARHLVEERRAALERQIASAQKLLELLAHQVVASEIEARTKAIELNGARSTEQIALNGCSEHRQLQGRTLDHAGVQHLCDELLARQARLSAYDRLAKTFHDLISDVRKEHHDLEGLRRELLSVIGDNHPCTSPTIRNPARMMAP